VAMVLGLAWPLWTAEAVASLIKLVREPADVRIHFSLERHGEHPTDSLMDDLVQGKAQIRPGRAASSSSTLNGASLTGGARFERARALLNFDPNCGIGAAMGPPGWL
jgi:hypothetical protein